LENFKNRKEDTKGVRVTYVFSFITSNNAITQF